MPSDVFTKSQRSKVMAAIRSRGNRSTEETARILFRKAGLSGWRRQIRTLPGTPDFVFAKERVAVFIDGCYWHGCMACSRNLRPSSNAIYWRMKIANNRRRDRRVSRILRSQGWRVIRVWEHQIKKHPAACVRRVATATHSQGISL